MIQSSRSLFEEILDGVFETHGIVDFHPEEFAPARREIPPVQLWTGIVPTAWVCQRLRIASGGPVHINSGYRPQWFNNSIGGAPGSQHLWFTAADIVSVKWTPEEVFEWLEEQSFSTLIAIGRYGTFTHIDTRHWKGSPLEGESPARWDNR